MNPLTVEPAPSEFDPSVARARFLVRQTEQQRLRLYYTALAAVICSGVYFAATAKVDDLVHLYLGVAIYFISLWPSLLWLKQGGSRFPTFEPMMALCANAYALPLLNGHSAFEKYPPDSVTLAAFGVLLYVLLAIFAYMQTGGLPGRSRFWTEAVFNRQVERYVSYGLVLSSLYMAVSTFTTWIPDELNSVLRAAFNGISILCTFVTAQRWGRNELKPAEKTTFATLLIVQLIILCASLYLIGSITLLGIALLGFISTGSRLPWLAVAITFAIAAVLHNGKADMREIYWEEQQRTPAVAELPSFFYQWVKFGLESPLFGSEKSESASSKLIDRTSLMHVLAMVAYNTPDRQPYLEGETYKLVLPQLVPRFFWPDKPRSHVATYRLSTYYGLQSEDATVKTTIAFGMPAEAYANFGLLGMAGLGAFFGFFLKRMQVLASNSPMFSLGGITMVLLTAWSLNAEFTLAVWVSSLFQAILVALGTPILIRSLLGD